MKIQADNGTVIIIRGDRLFEPIHYPHDKTIVRSVSRKQIAEVIAGKRTHVDGRFPHSRGPKTLKELWKVVPLSYCIFIGCMCFSGINNTIVRRWARVGKKS